MTVVISQQERDVLYSLISRRRSVRQFADAAIGDQALLRIINCAQAVNDSEGGRGAPSAHALHPMGLTVIVRRVSNMEPGSYRFDPVRQQLSRQGEAPGAGSLLPVSLAHDTWLEAAPVVIVITADYASALRHFADQQPDGQRGARYVDVEAGAIAQSLYLAALVENLGGVLVMGVDDAALADLLAMPPAHKPVALFCLGQCQT